LEGVFAPVYVPDRFDVFGSNWALVQPDTLPPYRGLTGILNRAVDPSGREAVQSLFRGTQLPAADFSAPSAGARLSWTAGGFDASYYYYYGFDGPYFQIDPRVQAALASTDFSTAGLTSLQPLLPMIDAGMKPIQVTYVRRHHLGTDLATTVGPFALRFEVGYDDPRVFIRRDLLSTTSPALQAVMAVEYQTGRRDQTLLVEAMYMRALDLQVPLMIWDRNSVGVGGLFRWPLFAPFSVELRALIGIRPVTEVIQPQIDMTFSNWVVSLGGLWLGGETYSFGQYFHRNREVYAKLKVSF
jgi:hypothetical protein